LENELGEVIEVVLPLLEVVLPAGNDAVNVWNLFLFKHVMHVQANL